MVTRTYRRMRRLPFEPLHTYLAARWGNHYFASAQSVDGRLVDSRVAELCGARNAGTALRWRREGLSVRIADRIAIHLGAHPCEIWSDFHDDIDTTREECA